MITAQVKHARAILTKLEECVPDSYDFILAGGAPRDWLLGFPGTDLDIYYYERGRNGERSTAEIPERALEGMGFFNLNSLTNPDDLEMYVNMTGIVNVREGLFQGNNLLKVQLIGSNIPLMNMIQSEFPDICQAYMFSDSPISSTGDFCLAHLDKESSHQWRPGRYLDKIRSKFPDYIFHERTPVDTNIIWTEPSRALDMGTILRDGSTGFVDNIPAPMPFHVSGTGISAMNLENSIFNINAVT